MASEVASLQVLITGNASGLVAATAEAIAQTRDFTQALLQLRQTEIAEKKAAEEAAAETKRLAAAQEAARKAAQDQQATFKAFSSVAGSMAPAVAAARGLREAMAPVSKGIAEIKGAFSELGSIAATLAAPFVAAFAVIAAAVAAVVAAATAAGTALFRAFQTANAVNPSGAISYGNAVRKLNDEWTTLVALVGEQVRPIIMAVVRVLTDVMDVVNRIQWGKLWTDAKAAFGGIFKAVKDVLGGVGDGLSTVLSVAGGIFGTLARIAVWPFDQLRKVSSEALAAVVSGLGTLVKYGAGIGEDLARFMAFPFDVMLKGASKAVSGVMSLITTLTAAMPKEIREKFALDGFDQAATQVKALAEAASKLNFVDGAKKLLPSTESINQAAQATAGLIRKFGETSTADLAKGAYDSVVAAAKAGLDKLKGLVAPGKATTLHILDDVDVYRAGIDRMLAEMAAKHTEMNQKNIQAAMEAAKIANSGSQERAKAAVESAQSAADIAKSQLADAYSRNAVVEIQAGQERYALAMKELNERRSAEFDILDAQRNAAADRAALLKTDLQKAADDVAKAEADYQRKLLDARAAAVDENARRAADLEVQRLKQASDAAIANQGRLQQMSVQAEQQVQDLANKEAENRNKAAIDTATRTADLTKQAADYERQQRERTLGQLQSLFGKSGIPELVKAYLDGSTSGFLGLMPSASSAASPDFGKMAGGNASHFGAGTASGAVNAAASGAQMASGSSGGLIGLIAAAVQLLSKTKPFQALMDEVAGIVSDVGEALASVIEPVVGLVKVVRGILQPALQGVGAVLGAAASGLVAGFLPIMPGLTMLSKALGDLLVAVAPLLQISVELFYALSLSTEAAATLTPALSLLADGIAYLAEGVGFVVEGIGHAWNWMIGGLQRFLQSLRDVPVIGDSLATLAGTLDSFKVKVTEAATFTHTSMTRFKDGVDTATDALDKMSQQISQSWGATLDAILKAQALSAAARQAAATAAKDPDNKELKAKADALAAAAQKAAQDATAASDQHAVDIAQAAFDAVRSLGPGNDQYEAAFDSLSAALGQQAYDTARNSAATDANTKATNALSGILNAPQGFKLESYRYAAIGAQSAIESGATGGAPTFLGSRGVQEPSVVVNINIDRVAATAEDVGDAVSKAIANFTFRRTGTLAPQLPGGRFSTSGQS